MRVKLTHIDKQEVLSYLQCHDDHNICDDIETGIEVILKTATPRVIYKQYALCDGQPQHCLVKLQGNDIQELLKTSSHCIFIAATLGNRVDALLRKLQVQDMGKALIYDACANAAIEQVLDDVQGEIATNVSKDKCYCSDRYSCGYGDLPLHLQANFIKELDTQKSIGLFSNAAHVLSPNKSVTAIIGISTQPQPALIKGCSACMLYETCQRRKAGNPCVKE